MKKSISVILCLCILISGVSFAVPVLAAEGAAGAEKSVPKDAVFLEGEKCEITTLDSVVAVKLESNPTTGYSWQCKVSNKKALQLVDSIYEAEETAKNVVGAGGHQYFVFTPKKTGTVKLTFSYVQAGSKTVEKKQVVTVKVTKAYTGTKPLTAKTSLRVGQTATITLDANATTGYEWNAELSNENVLAVRQDEYNAPKAAVPGAGGSHSFSFQALKKGKCVVTVSYKRSFEDEPIETLKYTVTVK